METEWKEMKRELDASNEHKSNSRVFTRNFHERVEMCNLNSNSSVSYVSTKCLIFVVVV